MRSDFNEHNLPGQITEAVAAHARGKAAAFEAGALLLRFKKAFDENRADKPLEELTTKKCREAFAAELSGCRAALSVGNFLAERRAAMSGKAEFEAWLAGLGISVHAALQLINDRHQNQQTIWDHESHNARN